MNTNYHYIIVTIINKQYFYSSKSDFTSSFYDVMKFGTDDEARDCITKNRFDEIQAEVIGVIESKSLQ